MRDEFNNSNNYGEDQGNDFQNESYNSTENNQESGGVNFELVNSTESNLAEKSYSTGGRTQYSAPTYGFQSGQGSRNEYGNGYSQQNNSGYQNSYGQQNNNAYQNSYEQQNNYGYQNSYGNNNASNYNYNQFSYTDNKGYSANDGFDNGSKKKDGKESFAKKLLKTAAIAAVFGLVAGVVFQGVNIASHKLFGIENTTTLDDTEIGVTTTQTPAISTSATTDVETLVENTMPAMVAITSTIVEDYRYFGHPFSQEAEGSGSGIIVGKNNNQLLIVTNNHVIAGAKTISVCFMDKEIVQADVKGTDPASDLAVVAVDMKDIKDETKAIIKVATLGDSDNVKLGQMAVAIGNALGYGQSVTVGYISALGRSVSVQDSTTGTMVVNNNLIQTDAAINPGNSGGALLNIKGEVIGINSVKYADTDVEGIGYAIPINDAMIIIDKMIDGEKIDESQSGYLGIQGKDSSLGAYVHSVIPGSAAQKAGIKAGDIITEFEGTAIATMSQLKELLSYYPAGEKVDFVILRPQGDDEYKEIKITVELGDASILNVN